MHVQGLRKTIGPRKISKFVEDLVRPSNDASNRFLNRVQLVPLTSRTDRLFPGEAPVAFEGQASKAMADQMATVTVSPGLELFTNFNF
jgi:mRNA-degrading endonuclease toxin of MazEF toxin-antitoxin module